MTEQNKAFQFEVNPEIAKIVTPQDIEIFKTFITNPKDGVNDESKQVVLAMIDKAAGVFGDDLVKETMYYLSATRRGLRIPDVAALVGESWDDVKFQTVATCFGVPMVGALDNALIIPSADLRALLFGTLSEADQKSFHSDIAYRLAMLPENDPIHITETMHHFLRSGKVEAAAEFFSNSRGNILTASAGAVGYSFAEEGDSLGIVSDMLDLENEKRFDLYRRYINEAFIAIMQNSVPEKADQFIGMVEQRLSAVMGERSTIENILLLALTSMRMASVKLRVKDVENGKSMFERGLGLMDNLMAQVQEPGKAFSWDNCEAVFNIGMICVDLHQPKAAAHCFDNAFKICKEKLPLEPAESTRKLFVASWYMNICRIFLQINDKEDGMKFFNEGKSIFKEVIKEKVALAAKKPEQTTIERDLMVMYNDFGDLCFAYGSKDEAEAAYENSLVIGERMAEKYPENVEFAISPSIACERLGRMFAELKENDKSQPYFMKAMEIRKKLRKDFPEDVRLAHDLAAAYHNLATLFFQAENKMEAEFYLIKQNEVLNELFDKNPEIEANVIGMLDIAVSLGDFYAVDKNFAKSLDVYKAALEKIRLLAGRQVGEPMLGRIATLHYKCGMAQIETKDQNEAYKNFQVALDLWNQLFNATKNPNYKQAIDQVQEVLKEFKHKAQ